MKKIRLCIIQNREHYDVMNKFMKLNFSRYIEHFKSYLLTGKLKVIWLPGNHSFGKYILVGFCGFFCVGFFVFSSSVLKVMNTQVRLHMKGHERWFHRRNRLLFILLYMLLILLRCFFLMILGLWNISYFVNNFVKKVSTAMYKDDMNTLTLLV